MQYIYVKVPRNSVFEGDIFQTFLNVGSCNAISIGAQCLGIAARLGLIDPRKELTLKTQLEAQPCDRCPPPILKASYRVYYEVQKSVKLYDYVSTAGFCL